MNNRLRMSARFYAEMIRLLVDGPCSCADLVEELGLSHTTIAEYLAALHKRGLLHIASWMLVPPKNTRKPVYAWGPGRDAKRPPWQTPAERQLAYRDRKRARKLQDVVTNMARSQT